MTLLSRYVQCTIRTPDGIYQRTSTPLPIQVADPVFVLTGDQLTITCSTVGASIYYNTTGSPTDLDTLYTGAITAEKGTPIQYYAIAYPNNSRDIISNVVPYYDSRGNLVADWDMEITDMSSWPEQSIPGGCSIEKTLDGTNRVVQIVTAGDSGGSLPYARQTAQTITLTANERLYYRFLYRQISGSQRGRVFLDHPSGSSEIVPPATPATWTEYSGTISSTGTGTFKTQVKGYSLFFTNGTSQIDDLRVWIAEPPTDPILSPATGTYVDSVDITMSTVSEHDVSIYYTDDGSTPSAAKTLYTGAVTLTASKTIKAIAIDKYGIASGITTETYTITPAP